MSERAPQADDAPDSLQHLVDLQGEVHPEGGQAQNQAEQRSQGNGSHPQEQIVCHHQHFGISPTAEDALGHNAVGSLEDNNDGNGKHELAGDPCRLVLQTVGVDHRLGKQEDDPRRHQAEDEADPKEGVALAVGFFFIPLSQGIARDDGTGLGEALGHHGAELLGHGGDGIRRHKALPHSADDHGHGIVAQCQNAVADEHGDADADVFLP